jgi:hypothetical protein
MRVKRKYESGDIRIKEKFLILPRTISRETRWLEKVRIKQRFEFYLDVILPLSEWTDIEWVD